jgi:hypothetical protein
MDAFAATFAELDDPRTGNAKQHDLHEILLIALCAVLCGGETCADMALFGRSKEIFLKSFMRLENGVPSHDTFSRVFRLLRPSSSAPASSPSCSALPKASRAWSPSTARRCGARSTGPRTAHRCTW